MSSLQGIPGVSDTTREFIYNVRGHMRDYPELNRLVRGVESTDRQIAWAIVDAVSEFNGTPHFTSLSLDRILAKGQYSLMLRLTIISLVESVALLQTRNHLNYSDGGISVGVNDKTPMLMSWLQLYKGETQQKMQRVKVAMNIEDVLGAPGVASEYWAINSTYASFG